MTLTAGGGAVEVAVRDDGDGFDPRDAGRLLAGSGGHADGFGLGLALARLRRAGPAVVRRKDSRALDLDRVPSGI
ncbi:ATP-binding protein [Actinomadura chokoriensis]|uniref:ATP-binding protein n=1 Tax=Actinomadura chokoriensis TaxID=454156 RepID=UPI0031F8072B